MPKEDTDLEFIDKQEIEIERVPKEELDKRDKFIPQYKEKVDLDEDQIKRLKDEIFKLYELLKKDRESEHLETKWDELEAQYKGEMADDTGLEFNLNVPVTMVKCDAVERLAIKALLESDPKFTVTARPQTAKMDKWDVIVQRQADYLDYKLDEEIDIVSPLRMVLHQACKLDCGILKVPYEYQRRKRRREERYSGKPEQDSQTGQLRQPGLESFLKQYPDAITPGNPGYGVFKSLLEGKDVVFKAEFWEVVYNDPKPQFVDIRDFFVFKDTEGYEGLCNARIIIERQKYTWWELKYAEKEGDFENVDQCKYQINEEGYDKELKEVEDYRNQPYEVLECIYYFNQVEDSDDPDDEIRITCWFEVKSKTFLGAIIYPYDAVESYYIPFYIKNKKAGFYKGGMAEDLKDSNLAQNAILNFMLTESWLQMVTTPIVREGSPIADQFVHKRWKPGIPIEVPITSLNLEQDLGFLDKPQGAVAAQLMNVLLFMGKLDDDRTGVSSLATGKESPIDPTAPAAKTAMLLKQSGINISDYINCIVPSFNKMGEIILQLTYQMSEKGRQYRHKQLAGRVTGGDPFEEISRDDMVAKTNIQSRAAAFDFDDINKKRELLAFYQVARADPIFSQNPEGIYTLARTLTMSWSPTLKNKVDQLLPDPQMFKMQQFKIALGALQVYLQQMQKKAMVTGVAQKPELQEYVALATQMMAQAITPPPPEAGNA